MIMLFVTLPLIKPPQSDVREYYALCSLGLQEPNTQNLNGLQCTRPFVIDIQIILGTLAYSVEIVCSMFIQRGMEESLITGHSET